MQVAYTTREAHETALPAGKKALDASQSLDKPGVGAVSTSAARTNPTEAASCPNRTLVVGRRRPARAIYRADSIPSQQVAAPPQPLARKNKRRRLEDRMQPLDTLPKLAAFITGPPALP